MNQGKPSCPKPAKRILILVFVLGLFYVVFPGRLFAQEYRKFDVNNGLTQNTVSSIVQDEKGRLWIGTGNGVNCYNGYEMVRYFSASTVTQAIPGNRIRSVYVGLQNEIWLGTSAGIGKINQSTGKSEAVIVNRALPESMVLFEHQGKLIVLSGQEGICSIDLKSGIVTTILPRPRPFTGTLSWGRINNQVVISWNDEWLISVSRHGVVKKWLKLPEGTSVNSLSADKDALYLFTGKGVLRVKNGSDRFTPLLLPGPLTGNISAGLIHSDQVLLLAVEKMGLFSYSLSTGKVLAEYSVSTGNPDFQIVKCLFTDQHQNVWVGTDGAGLIKLNQKRRRFYPLTRKVAGQEERVPYFTRPVMEDTEQQILLGTLHNGICVLNRTSGKETLISLRNGIEVNPQIICMERLGIKGKLLTGTRKGLFVVDPATGNSEVVVKDHAVSAICRLKDTLLLVSFSDNAELRLYIFKNEVLTPGDRVLDSLRYALGKVILNPVDKKLLLCGSAFGVAQLPLQELFQQSGRDLKFSFNAVKINDGIFLENGGMILGSAGGLLKTDRNLKLEKELNRANGLPDDYINVLLPDHNGYFWATTNLGVLRVKNDFSSFQGFNRTDGIHELEFNTGAPARLRSGEVAFGTVAGVVLFNPDAAIENEHHAYPRMSDLLVNGRRQFLSNGDERVQLRYSENSLQFNVYSTDLTTPENNLFSFFLEGADDTWSLPSSGRSVWYQHLNPGNYELKAKGINSAGVWGPSVTLLRFEISPPFWGTAWFKITAILVILSMIGAVSAFLFSLRLRRALARERRAKQIENIRSGISRNIHDEIGAGLSRIALMTSLAKRTRSQERLDDFHEKLLRTSQDLTKNLGEIVWAVNPKHDNLNSMVFYVRDYIYETLEDTGILPDVKIPEHLPGYPVSPDFRNHLFLTIKEAINNVVKHSGADRFEFHLSLDGRKLNIRMSDNGRGYSSENVRTFGNGLQNMQWRMLEIGAVYQLESQPGKGTAIFICLQL